MLWSNLIDDVARSLYLLIPKACCVVRTSLVEDKRGLYVFSVACLAIWAYARARTRCNEKINYIWQCVASDVLKPMMHQGSYYTSRAVISENMQANLYQSLEIARKLRIKPSDACFELICSELARTKFPSFMIKSEKKSCKGSELLAHGIRLLLVPCFLFEALLFGIIYPDISQGELEVMQKFPEVLSGLKDEYKQEIQMAFTHEIVRKTIGLLNYIVLSSYMKTLSYITVASASLVSQTIRSRWFSTSSTKVLQADIFEALSRLFFGTGVHIEKSLISPAEIHGTSLLCLGFFCGYIIDTCVESMLMKCVVLTSSMYRKVVEVKFYQALENAPTEFFDLHSFDDIEEMYYYIHDLEGVDTQLQVMTKNVVKTLSKLRIVSKTLHISPLILVSLLIFRFLASRATVYMTATLDLMSLSELDSLAAPMKSITRSSMHLQIQRDQILFHNELYQALIQNIKSLRCIGVGNKLLKEFRLAAAETPWFPCLDLSSFASTSILKLFKKLQGSAPFCFASAVTFDDISQAIVLILNRPLMKFVNFIQICVEALAFLLSVTKSDQNSCSIDATRLIAGSFDAIQNVGKDLTSCMQIFDLIYHNAYKATELNDFFAPSEEEKMLYPAQIRQSAPSFHPCENADGKIELQNISFRYFGKQIDAVHKVSAQIPLGSFTVIRGRNGCGKSSLLSLLAGVYAPAQGSITLAINHDSCVSEAKFIDIESWQSLVACLGQEHALLPCSMRTNILCARTNINPAELEKLCKKLGLWEDIENLSNGLDTIVGRGKDAVRLSKGQAQKVMLARAFSGDTRILLLDEPSNFLDIESKCRLLSMIRSFLTEGDADDDVTLANGEPFPMRAIPRTVVCVSHDEQIIANADFCIELSKSSQVPSEKKVSP